jgi:peptidoglycan hydrolase CwlO-like protein
MLKILTPIEPEEMPSSDFFFNKKRKAIVQREIHNKGGVITKRQRMIFDGQGQSDPEFAKQVADSLGAFATTNLWSVDNLREKIDQKNLLIEQLQNDLKQTEAIIKERVSSELAQV